MQIHEVEVYNLVHYFNTVLIALESKNVDKVEVNAEEFKAVSKELQQRKMITFH